MKIRTLASGGSKRIWNFAIPENQIERILCAEYLDHNEPYPDMFTNCGNSEIWENFIRAYDVCMKILRIANKSTAYPERKEV